MIRSVALAAILATGLSLPALAGDAPATEAAADPAAFTATLNYAASANTARKILIGRGYTQVRPVDTSIVGQQTADRSNGASTSDSSGNTSSGGSSSGATSSGYSGGSSMGSGGGGGIAIPRPPGGGD